MQVSQAEVPPRGFTAASAAAVHSVGMYLTIRNPTGQADELIGVTSPLARRVVLTRGQTVVSELTVPAHGTLTVAPSGGASGASAILEDPRAYETRPTVPLVLTFRHTGTLTVNAAVNAPGS
jgi:copper(I)-binding protein